MKTYQLQKFGFDGLIQTDAPDPKPGPGQVILRMRAWSLNYRDLMVVKGDYNPKMKLPAVPFSDGVGEVVSVGEGVTRVRVGQRVAGTFFQEWIEGPLDEAKGKSALGGGGAEGMLAEYVVLNAKGVVSVPAHLTDEQAATLPCAAVTAWNALLASGTISPGQSVLLQGTGGVSIFALQFAKLAGARIIITSSSDEKLERAKSMGAESGINYRTEPDWTKRVRELTGNVGVDHVVEVGGAGTLPQSMRAVRVGGTISLIGVLTGNKSEVNPTPMLARNIRMQGIYVGSRAMFEAMNHAISLHHVVPVVDRVFLFDRAVDALKHLESGGHFGKVCVRA